MIISKTQLLNKMQTVYQCDSNGREKTSVAADMDGTLLIETSSFPYFALIAFDVGGILRLLLLLLASPISWLLYHFVSESAGIRILIFATFSGVRVSAIESAASAVLPKYYSEDLHPETWRVFSSCGRKCVITANPRIMVEPFLTNYLGVDVVMGTEISSYKGIATGLVASPGLLVGKNKATVLKNAFGTESMPDIGLGDRESDFPFMNLCKDRYIVPSKPGVRPVRQDKLPKPVIFHDGRLVQKPTPLVALLIILWFPIAIPLSILRILFGTFCPFSIILYVFPLLGCPITVKGILSHVKRSPGQRGVLLVSCHKTVLDPSYISGCLGLKATAVAYSVPNFSLLLTQLKTVTLTRDRTKDAELIEQALSEGEYLVICPEGTTCREPYLLRFSSLFAELTDQIVPVAVDVNTSLFHGSTARGYKVLDPFFFFMNPLPKYEITFLEKLTGDQIDGQSCHEIANRIQEMIAAKLDFKCTKFTRKDKYQILAGTDGLVGQKPRRSASKVEGK